MTPRPACPICKTCYVAYRKRLGRWHCRNCKKPISLPPPTRGEVAGRKVIRGYVF
jgi:ribosomal protein L37AE/L43A